LDDRQLLANLWARGTALQCAFNQGSIDALLVTYHGSIESSARFEPRLLSGVVVQVKNKAAGDVSAEGKIRPIGVPRYETAPRPYLSLVLELGTEAQYQETGSPIKVEMEAGNAAEFGRLVDSWRESQRQVGEYQEVIKSGKTKEAEDELKKARVVMKTKREAMDGFNRYVISIRGLSAYAVLEKAGIKTEFETLLKATSEAGGPGGEDSTERMHPLRKLRKPGGHTAWMRRYVGTDEGSVEEVDIG
jgi:hypothetical protein